MPTTEENEARIITLESQVTQLLTESSDRTADVLALQTSIANLIAETALVRDDAEAARDQANVVEPIITGVGNLILGDVPGDPTGSIIGKALVLTASCSIVLPEQSERVLPAGLAVPVRTLAGATVTFSLSGGSNDILETGSLTALSPNSNAVIWLLEVDGSQVNRWTIDGDLS